MKNNYLYFCILQVFCTQPWHCLLVLQLISKNWWWRIWRSIRNLKRRTYDIICCISGTFCFQFKEFTCLWNGMHDCIWWQLMLKNNYFLSLSVSNLIWPSSKGSLIGYHVYQITLSVLSSICLILVSPYLFNWKYMPLCTKIAYELYVFLYPRSFDKFNVTDRNWIITFN